MRLDTIKPAMTRKSASDSSAVPQMRPTPASVRVTTAPAMSASSHIALVRMVSAATLAIHPAGRS